MREETTFIYALKDPLNGDIRYIGKSDCPEARLKSHWNDSRKSSSPLGDWLRSSMFAPAVEILAEVPYEMWEEYEREAIHIFRYGGARLVNSTDGGEAGPSPRGRKASKETRRLLREQKLGDKNPQFGREYSFSEREERRLRALGSKNPFHGRKHTSESRAKISLAKKGQGKGRKLSPEHRQKLSISRSGKPGTRLSDSAKLKLSRANSGENNPMSAKNIAMRLARKVNV